MTIPPDSVWLVTGASSGFGAEFVAQALAAGHRVVATARDPGTLAHVAGRHPDRVLVRALDVTDADQSARVVAEAERHFGSLDVLVNNAGFGYFGAIEEGEEEAIRRVFEVNVFALARLTRLVLPGMRARRRGTIVNLSSIGGLSANPGAGYYAATKFAVEALSESLAAEVAGFGIGVLIVEPGLFRTDFMGRSVSIASANPAYAGTSAAANRDFLLSVNGKQPGDPAAAVRIVLETLAAEKPPLRLLLGRSAIDRALNRIDAVREAIVAWRSVSESAEF
jgi:NAD(P)-dependent dehydrogenase (short-subunit alcohol dehydrogenase family)